VRTNRRIVLTVVPIIGIGAVIWLSLALRPPPEPVYQGKPLSYWLAGYNPPAYQLAHPHGPAPPSYVEANTAIREIGTNAVPILLRMLQGPDATLKDRLWDLARKQHFFAVPPRFYPNPKFEIAAGFRALGKTASNAVPSLIVMFTHYPTVAFLQQAVPEILGDIGPAARRAVPILLRAATHTNQVVRNNAIFALGKIGAEPDSVVPVLINRLKDTDTQVRTQAARALGAFGGKAGSATPALIELWSNEGKHNAKPVNGINTSVSLTWQTSWPPTGTGNPPDPSAAAADALLKIDPESAAKVGVK